MPTNQKNNDGCKKLHEGRLAIVTGSERSIGAVFVRNLTSKGCNIIINYATTASDERAAKLASEISKTSECEKIIGAVNKHLTDPETGSLQIDILIHNAAALYLGPLASRRRGRVPAHLITPSGRIVMLSSINPKVGLPNTYTLYSGTKAALEALARVWRRELVERTAVNCINPGPVMTDMYMSVSEDVKKQLALWNPVYASVRRTVLR
ncbi:Tetrahydroxynaphthalene reductase [Cytospora mali]|uniref:Tetrahydroxynaphthalene reductase n=1 Tax=Cytospora mali TaxID=578113 RepID=A0A194VYT8_CYTMA|nr:Tetrahydroxynaphthalene reductase [Valsa mali]